MAEKKGVRAVAVIGIAVALTGTAIYIATRKAKAAPPENILLSDLAIEPTKVYVRQVIEINVTITNIGGVAGSYKVICQVTPETVADGRQKTVTLEPGESKIVKFAIVATQPGIYQVTIGNLAGSFEVIQGLYLVGFGIYDSTLPRYISGAISVDSIQYTLSQDRYEITELLEGTHAFNLTIPSGYEFVRWDIYDWTTNALLEGNPDLPLLLNIQQDVFIRAIVRPAGIPPETLRFTIEIVGFDAGYFEWRYWDPKTATGVYYQSTPDPWAFPIGQMEIKPEHAKGRIFAWELPPTVAFFTDEITVKDGDYIKFNALTGVVTFL
jgi:hypothetical protein